METILRLPSELGAEGFKTIWSLGEVKHIGSLFATWLARIRHRGAFMALSPCYSRACSALLLCKDWPEVQGLPVQWLQVRSSFAERLSVPKLIFSSSPTEPHRLDRLAKDLHHSSLGRYPLLHPRHSHRRSPHRQSQLRPRLPSPTRDRRVQFDRHPRRESCARHEHPSDDIP
jgi:hypothetical protein